MIYPVPQPGELSDADVFGPGGPPPGLAPAPQPAPMQAGPRPGEMSDAEVFGPGGAPDAQPMAHPGGGLVFGPGSPMAGQPVPPDQARGYAALQIDRSKPVGHQLNPFVEWDDGQGHKGATPAGMWSLDRTGRLHGPSADYGGFADLVPKADGAHDAAQSIVPGLVQGVTGLLGAPADFLHAVDDGAQWVGGKLAGALHVPYRTGGGDPASILGVHLPSSIELNNVVQQHAGAYQQPQTVGGRYAEAIASFAPSAIFGGGGLVPRVAGVIAPAVAGQGAADIAMAAGHPELARWANMGASLATGHAVASGFGPSGAQRVLADQTRAMTPEQVAATQSVRQAGERVGVPVSLPEAAQHATGNGTGLAQVQRAVEAKPAGQAIGEPVLNARPAAARNALAEALESFAPATETPSALGPQAQRAAQSVVAKAEGQRTAAASPFYRQAAAETLAPEDMHALLADIDAKVAADKTGIVAGPLKSLREKLTTREAATPDQQLLADVHKAWAGSTGQPLDPATQAVGPQPILDLENLDRARKFVRDDAAGRLGRGTLTPKQASTLTGFADRIDTMLEDTSAAYRKGKATYADMSDKVVTPVTSGPTGKIAATADVPTQTAALYPSRPLEGAPAETAATVHALNEAAPGVAAALTRQHLASAGAEAMQDGTRGPNLYGPAAFAAGVRGNPIQGETLDAGARILGGDKAADDFSDLMKVFDATGRRLPAAPAETESLARLLSAKGVSGHDLTVTGGVAHEAFGPMGLVGAVGANLAAKGMGAFERMRVNRNARELGKLIWSPAEDTTSTIQGAQTAEQRRRALLAQALAETAVAGSR